MVNGNETEIQPIVQSRCDGDGQACSDLAWRNAGVLRLTVDPAAAVEHGVQQHIAASGDVFGQRVFDFVVADAVFARNKNHGGWGQFGGVDRIVASARDHGHVAQAEVDGGLANGLHALGVELLRSKTDHAFQVDGQSAAFRQRSAIVAYLLRHGFDRVVGVVAKIDGERHPTWNDVAAVGVDMDHADGATTVGCVPVGDGHHLLHDAGCNL